MKKANYITILTLGVLVASQSMATGPDEYGVYLINGSLHTSASGTDATTCGDIERAINIVDYGYTGCEACGGLQYCRVSTYTTSGECNETNAAYYSGVKGKCTAIAATDVKTAEIEGLGTVTYSNGSMNWWSAKTWCEALGLHLIDRATMRTYFDALFAASGKNYGWTITTYGSAQGDFTCKAYLAGFVYGVMDYGGRNLTSYAFCL